jgi:hypothetical protein
MSLLASAPRRAAQPLPRVQPACRMMQVLLGHPAEASLPLQAHGTRIDNAVSMTLYDDAVKLMTTLHAACICS